MGPQLDVDPPPPAEPRADPLVEAAGAVAVVEVADAAPAGAAAGTVVDGAVGASPAVVDGASPVAGAEPVSPSLGVASLVVVADFARTLSRKSFLAHPEPLNTMAGAVSALRIDPPQTAHAAGPLAEIEWITSTLVPHASQT